MLHLCSPFPAVSKVERCWNGGTTDKFHERPSDKEHNKNLDLEFGPARRGRNPIRTCARLRGTPDVRQHCMVTVDPAGFGSRKVPSCRRAPTSRWQRGQGGSLMGSSGFGTPGTDGRMDV